ncbi:type III-A CRISPR-associated protein Csm2 [Ligilactobacillus animalis]|nr:type III-A CRISPR-associated protein Csm2 [Ligilactobacillus animalis]
MFIKIEGKIAVENREKLVKPVIKFKNSTYVDEAKIVISELKKVNFRVSGDTLTTSQLRNLLSFTSSIYDEARNQGIESVLDRIAYLRVQFIYQSGRNAAVRKLVDLTQIDTIIRVIQQNKDEKYLMRLCHYMEALVAFFKYYGGKE